MLRRWGEQPASVETGSASPNNSQPLPFHPPSLPTTPHFPPITCYYTSPHSPTSLRFPPAPSFPEWRGRCFRCFCVGHPASKSCNQLKCDRCWMDGHNISKCKTPLNPATKPFSPKQPEPAKQHPPSSKTTSARPISTKPQDARQQKMEQQPLTKTKLSREPSFMELLNNPSAKSSTTLLLVSNLAVNRNCILSMN